MVGVVASRKVGRVAPQGLTPGHPRWWRAVLPPLSEGRPGCAGVRRSKAVRCLSSNQNHSFLYCASYETHPPARPGQVALVAFEVKFQLLSINCHLSRFLSDSFSRRDENKLQSPPRPFADSFSCWVENRAPRSPDELPCWVTVAASGAPQRHAIDDAPLVFNKPSSKPVVTDPVAALGCRHVH